MTELSCFNRCRRYIRCRCILWSGCRC